MLLKHDHTTTTLAVKPRDADLLAAAAADLRQAVDNLPDSAGVARAAAGRKLATVKRRIEHGRFLPALKAAGIPPRRAARAILAHKRASQIVQAQIPHNAESAVFFDGGIHG